MNEDETQRQLSHEKETSDREWSRYFTENCATSLIAPVKGEWRIKGIRLSETDGYQSGTGTQWLFNTNHIKGVDKMIQKSIKPVDVRWQTLDNSNQVLAIGPLTTHNRKSRNHIQNIDLPDEDVYCIDLQVHSVTNEAVSRGANCMTARVLCPQSKAIAFLNDVRAVPRLFDHVLQEMYPGIENREVTYPTDKVTIVYKQGENTVTEVCDLTEDR